MLLNVNHPAPPAAVRRGRGRRPPLVPLVIVATAILAAVIGPYVAPFNPNAVDFSATFRAPGGLRHLLGTDELGRDVLSRVVHGARYSVALSVASVVVAALVGTAIGLVAGFKGGLWDAVLMRFTDIAFSVPVILFALVLVTVAGRSFTNVVLVVVFHLWAQHARQVRGEVLSISQRDFVTLARASGVSQIRIMVRHVLPHVLSTVLVMCSLQVGWVILFESSLSFLGVGLPPPTPAWGLMVADGRSEFVGAWWVWVFPGLAITGTLLGSNLLGDWIRDAVDPKIQGSQ